MIDSIIAPKRPLEAESWVCTSKPAFATEVWDHPEGVRVISAVENAAELAFLPATPHYHISISFNQGRIEADFAQVVLQLFGMDDAEEDNHVPDGIARNYWMPVAVRNIGKDCICKSTEPAIVEGDYVWRP